MCSLSGDWITSKGPVHLLCRAGESASINYSVDADGDPSSGAASCRFFFPDTSCLVAGLAEAQGAPPGHSRAWLVAPLRGGREQAANPCRGSGVWQQWLRQLEINFPAATALCYFVHRSTAGTALKGCRVETALWILLTQSWVQTPTALLTSCAVFLLSPSASSPLKQGPAHRTREYDSWHICQSRNLTSDLEFLIRITLA